MAKSSLVLNTENPVTSSRIKYAHTPAQTHMHTQGLPTWKRFLTKTQVPATPVEKAAGLPRPGLPHAPSAGGGDRCGGGGAVGRPENATFCL